MSITSFSERLRGLFYSNVWMEESPIKTKDGSEKPPKPCDQCYRRKVRCNYEIPCNRCSASNLGCTHSIVRKKRGPRKGKGAVLDTLRSGSHILENSESISPLGTVSEPGTPNGQKRPPANFLHELPPTSGETQLEQPLHITGEHQPLPHSTSYDFSQTGPTAIDESYLTFDEFAQNVLADSNYFSYEPVANFQNQPSIFSSTPSIPTVTPLDGTTYETPQTALATTVALADGPESFEITPLVERSVELFFEHMYPTYPVISKHVARGWIQNPELLSMSEQTLIWSICASTLVMVEDWPNLGLEQRAVSARRFIRKCSLLRLEWDYMEETDLYDIVTSLFIANAYFQLKCRRASWTFVRQAITLATVAGLHDDSGYISFSEEDQLRRRRTYAMLFITERGGAILDSLPVSIITPPPFPSQLLADEDPTLVAGLTALHGLFCLLDFKFVKLWNDPTHTAFGSTLYSDLSLLQRHLGELRIDTVGLSDVHRADILITQQWLRLIFWQTALKLGYISTAAHEASFKYRFPIDIAMDLCDVVKKLPPVAIHVHGLGIFEKQFEVAYSLMDTLALSETTQPESHECLRYLLLSLSASQTSRQLYVRTLEKKMGGQQKYRSLGGVQLLRDEGGSRQNSRNPSVALPRTHQAA